MSCILRTLHQFSTKRLPKFHRSLCSQFNDLFSEVEGDSKKKEMTPVLTGERSVNRVTLIGRLGRDPETRGSEQNPVVLFSLATSLTLRDPDGEYIQKTDWHRIATFRPKVREWVMTSLRKGDRVYVSGSIKYGTFQDKVTNQQVRAVSIVADDIVTLMKHSEGRNIEDSPVPDTERGDGV